jgi:hypothetical protein
MSTKGFIFASPNKSKVTVMSTQILSNRHYSAIRITLYQMIDTDRQREYIYPIVTHQRAYNHNFAQTKETIDRMVQQMYRLNQMAYANNYQEPFTDGEELVFEKALVLEPTQLFKLFDAWNYNSIDALEATNIVIDFSPEQHRLLQLAIDVFTCIGKVIVRKLPEYQNAKWVL